MPELQQWAGRDGDIGRFVEDESAKMVEAYRAKPSLVAEHYEMEREILTGGYGRRQLFELVQNAADAIQSSGKAGRVELVLAGATLYCANEGVALDAGGAQALLMAHLSAKTGDQIGRFGLGFKSVIGISDAPEFFSRSGSLRFDPGQAEARIREAVPDCGGTPRLRIAQVLDPEAHAVSDSHLHTMMGWATTVVRLPLRHEAVPNLTEDLRTFPAHFLIFAPWISELRIIDVGNNRTRVIQVQQQGEIVFVTENDQVSSWSVFSDALPVSKLSEEARGEVGRLITGRNAIPVIWAVPSGQGRRVRGSFWAFFPTKTESTLSGILNAPWKTHSDRESLMDGPFNRELLAFAVRVVASNLGKLAETTDPGSILDVLPARDTIGWADSHLAEILYERLRTVPCIPSVNGALGIPANVRLRPNIALLASVRTWLDENSHVEPAVWCHRSVETRERRARADRLGSEKWDLEDWLRSIVQAKTAVVSTAAVRLAGSLLSEKEFSLGDKLVLMESPFILTTTNNLLSPLSGSLYIDNLEGDHAETGTSFVHPDLLSVPGVREILEGSLELQTCGPSSQLENLLATIHSRARQDWGLFWRLARRLEVDQVVHILHAKNFPAARVSARNRRKEWVAIGRSLLPGDIVPDEGASTEDDAVTIDTAGEHATDVVLLDRFGAVRTVRIAEVQASEGGWFEEYLSDAIQKYQANIATGQRRPNDSYLSFQERTTAGPLDPLMSMCLASRARMVKQLLPLLTTNSDWTLKHCRNAAYPPMPFPDPVRWMVKRYGALETSLGPRLVPECVSPSLGAWRSVLPVAACSLKQAELLDLPTNLGNLPESVWAAAFDTALNLTDVHAAACFYAEASHRPVPTSILCDVGGIPAVKPPRDVCITTDHAAFMASQAASRPVLIVADTDKASRLHERWHLPWAGDAEVKFIATGVNEPLVDRFPGLRRHLFFGHLELLICPCASIWIETSGTSGLPERRMLDDQAVICPDRLLYPDLWSEPQLLDGVIRSLKLNIATSERQVILDYLAREERQKCTCAVRAAQSLPEKLVVAIGGTALRTGLPALWRERCSSDQSAANCALAIYGVQVLAHYGNELESAGLNPPTRWGGSRRALEFVRELGIPDEYAGFRLSDTREPWFEVDGPVRLAPLHPYQETIVERLVQTLQRVPPGRGMLSLPTGAGKTRVAVDAVVNWIRERPSKKTLILWIAQSDELCEQAVQTWSRTWRAAGPPDCTLRITRLWGGTNREAEESHGECHIVVATYQTLSRRTGDSTLSWVFEPDCVLIDEAHGAIAPSYTEILARLGLTHAQTNRCLIGLTATPFRNGEFEDETLRLVRRFASERFDHGVFEDDDPHADLRRQRILADVEHRELKGVDVQLTPAEEVGFDTFDTLPPSAERRLGENTERNTRLLECLTGLDRSWPVLVFAASVEQAEMLAVELCMSGIEARAITGGTDRGARAHYIQEFRAGRVRILTNYNVLTAGFDAPAVRAICIARPVFSRVLYQQMIGRGLRGPLNGGKDTCLLINVSDNVSQYGRQLAFRHFEHLWKRD